MSMTDREKIHVYRVLSILAIIICTVLFSLALTFLNQLYWDEMICVGFLDATFLVLIVYELEYERRKKLISKNRATTYARVAIGYALCAVCTVGFYFLPEYYRFFMIIPFIMFAMSNEVLTMICSSFFVMVFALICGCNLYEVIGYGVLILFGVILAKSFCEASKRVWIAILTFLSNVLIVTLFSYMESNSIDPISYAGAAIAAVVSVVVLLLIPPMRRDTEKELSNRLMDIMAEDYIERRELRDYYPADYEHALRVSEIARRCGAAMGLNGELCEAAGFYYRIGKWMGEPHVENGILRATRLCFPVELVTIIAEYYGEEQLPSTPESALIHMIDALTIKMDAITKDVGLSDWNKEMVIYQTLNEFSNSGLYDICGISMNQFLKIREMLVKENWAR